MAPLLQVTHKAKIILDHYMILIIHQHHYRPPPAVDSQKDSSTSLSRPASSSLTEGFIGRGQDDPR